MVLAARKQYETRGIVPNKSGARTRLTEGTIRLNEISEERMTSTIRKAEAEAHQESIYADIAEVGVEIASNQFYKAEIDRDTSEIEIDRALVQRDIARELLTQEDGQLAYLETKTDLLLEQWEQELRAISAAVDIREFENDNIQLIAEGRGVEVAQFQFKGIELKGQASRLLGGSSDE